MAISFLKVKRRKQVKEVKEPTAVKVKSTPKKTVKEKIRLKTDFLKNAKQPTTFKTRDSEPEPIKKQHPYRQGGEGFILWVEQNCRLPIYPPGSDIPLWYAVNDFPDEYKSLWQEQKKVLRQALEMVNGRFVYNLITFCWMRGEGKSLVVCLIQLWKFFCWPRQNITLGANSKEQTKFVHYDIMRDIILNSPRLLALIGKKNIQEKEIRLRDGNGNTISTIRAISSFTGIVSNITGFTFSEMFDMKNPKFFTQLYGSIRNVPNALGTIDSTVSAKTHILYTLYDNYIKSKTKKVFFSHRKSNDAIATDYWNPNMSQEQLDDFRATMLPGDFDQYFRNTWESGGARIFTREMIDAVFLYGFDGRVMTQHELLDLLGRYNKVEDSIDAFHSRAFTDEMLEKKMRFKKDVEDRIMAIDDNLYKFNHDRTGVVMASIEDLERLGDVYNTDWVILCGGDRADPMKEQLGARTIFTAVAKGLQNSRDMRFDVPPADAKYIYFLLGMWALSKHTLEEIKDIIETISNEFDGIDMLAAERWGMWDLDAWCKERDIEFEALYPTYDRQKAAFTEFFLSVRDGRFKSPKIPIPGTKGSNLLAEEMSVFDHDTEKKWFGSSEKKERHGIQDDTMYSLAWGMYGGREKNCDHFRPRRKKPFFGRVYKNTDLVANYV